VENNPKNVLSGVAAFQYPILRRSLGQLTTSFGGFLATCAAMYLCLTISLWMTLPLSVIAAGFLFTITTSLAVAVGPPQQGEGMPRGFGFLIFMLGVRHPPPLNDLSRLDAPRKLVGLAAIVILIVTFIPQPFVAVGTERSLAFEDLNGLPLSKLPVTIALGTSVNLTFAVNNTGAVRDSIVIVAREPNLAGAGFVIRFTGYRIGANRTTVSTDTVQVELNASQRVVLDLQVVAPTSWSIPLPQDLSFLVHATTPLAIVSKDLLVTLHLTA